MNTRTCKVQELNTGASACPYDPEEVIGALVVAHGHKLPANLTGTSLEEACHADRPDRVLPIGEFGEYAKSGGEVQLSAVGYGPNKPSGVSAWTDAFTLIAYNSALKAALAKTMGGEYDVYFYDRNNILYGLDDGTEQLAGFPMSSIYPTDTPHPSSGSRASLAVNFCHKDARKAMEQANFMQLDFDIASFARGLVPVKFVSLAANRWKLVEVFGGLDRTDEFGQLLVDNATKVLSNVSSVSYNAGGVSFEMAGGTPAFKAPSVLYTNGIKFIEGA